MQKEPDGSYDKHWYASWRVLAAILALISAVIFLGVLASGARHHSNTSASKTKVPPPSPSYTTAPSLNTSKALLDDKGIGIDESDKFTTSANWEVDWAYDCSAIRTKSQFAFGVADSKTRSGYPDVAGVKVFGDKGSGVQHYHRSGTHFLIIDSRCIWHVVVKE